jgi:hypothetical protein
VNLNTYRKSHVEKKGTLLDVSLRNSEDELHKLLPQVNFNELNLFSRAFPVSENLSSPSNASQLKEQVVKIVATFKQLVGGVDSGVAL